MPKQKMVLACVAAVPCFLFLYWTQNRPEADPMLDILRREPTLSQIRASMEQVRPQNATETPLQAKERIFATHFKKRFRDAEPQVPVALRLESNRVARLLCPARMEPWVIDRIAMTAWREIREAFGATYQLHIYETYIGLPAIKIAEIKQVPGTTDSVRIAYQFSKSHYVQRK